MKAGRNDASKVLGALLGGDASALERIVQQANAQRQAARQQLADTAAAHELEIPESAYDAMRQGRLVEAIRDVRRANPGLDLKTAKEAVERLAREVPVKSGKARSQAAMAIAKAKRPPTVASGDRGGIRAVVYALALAGGALAWWMFRGG